jgi:hypothetical protein
MGRQLNRRQAVREPWDAMPRREKHMLELVGLAMRRCSEWGSDERILMGLHDAGHRNQHCMQQRIFHLGDARNDSLKSHLLSRLVNTLYSSKIAVWDEWRDCAVILEPKFRPKFFP